MIVIGLVLMGVVLAAGFTVARRLRPGIPLQWHTVATLPQDFRKDLYLPCGADRLLIAGSLKGESGNLEDFELAIFDVTGGDATLVFSGVKGWVKALASHGDNVWVVFAQLERGRDRRRHFLIKSHDQGRHWQPPVPISVADGGAREINISRLVLQNAHCAWARGYGFFLRTCDGGDSWQTLHHPLEDDGVYLFTDFDAEGRLWIGNREKTMVSYDHGQSWQNVYAGHMATADNRFFVADEGEAMHISQWVDNEMRPLALINQRYLPEHLVCEADRLLISATLAPQDTTFKMFKNEVYLLLVADQGRRYEKQRFHGLSSAKHLIPTRFGQIWAATPDNQVRVAALPDQESRDERR